MVLAGHSSVFTSANHVPLSPFFDSPASRPIPCARSSLQRWHTRLPCRIGLSSSIILFSATAVLPMNDDISCRIILGQAIIRQDQFSDIFSPHPFPPP